MRSSILRFTAIMVALFLVRLPAVAADKPIPGGIHLTAAGPKPRVVGLKHPASWNLMATAADQQFVNDEILHGEVLWTWMVVRVQTNPVSAALDDKNWIDDPNWNRNPKLSKDIIPLTKKGQTATSSCAHLIASFVTAGFKKITVKVRLQFRGKDGNIYWADKRTYLVVAVIEVTSVTLEIDPTGRSLPGGIVLVNHGDFNLNEIPDYADMTFPVYEPPAMVPMSLTIAPANLDWAKVNVVFDYPGEPLTAKQLAGEALDAVGKMRNYSGAKRGTLRIWRQPPANRGADKNRKIDDYLVPRKEYNAKDDLGFAGQNNKVFFFLEGINAQKDVAVKVKVVGKEHSQTVQVVESNIGVNNSNYFAGAGTRPLRVGVPDVPFFIDEHVADGHLVADARNPTPGSIFAHDEMVEDQGAGFRFWWTRGWCPYSIERLAVFFYTISS